MNTLEIEYDSSDWEGCGFSTLAIHAGQEPAPGCGAIMTPVYFTSTYVQPSPGVAPEGYDYARTGNPTRTALEANLAALEGGNFGICFSSGLAAADAVFHLFSSGDEVVCTNDLYGGTFRLLEHVFRNLGLKAKYADLSDSNNLLPAISTRTKLVWVETPTNPLLKIVDIKKVSEIAKEHGAMVVVDNTFASPYLQRPLLLGADLVLHSSTKYIGGHSDLIGGALITSQRELAEKLHFLQNAVGAVPSPLDCFLQLRSTKTLAVRMDRHCENALKVASFLSQHPDVGWIRYPGLESHPQYALAKKQMLKGGGMISMEIKGGLSRAKKFLEHVKLFSLAESLGGVESLIEHPAIMTHASIPKELREEGGITDGLIRLSVGIEDADDLIRDLTRAFHDSN